ncbi:inactive N-acetylated-alpha-linked acidic dipeptidase-like protein 2 isoform X1 [Ictidomys tridecemlineatus]
MDPGATYCVKAQSLVKVIGRHSAFNQAECVEVQEEALPLALALFAFLGFMLILVIVLFSIWKMGQLLQYSCCPVVVLPDTLGPNFLSEAVFPKHATKIEEMDPFFNLHETISKLSGEVILQIANEPVLPFNALDIALEVQNSLKGDHPNAQHLLAMASRLRESAELFQSDEMRPANDPKERAPVRVRMLNDILQDMEKSFLVQQVPPGFYRNILYHTDEKTSQFSILMEAWEHCKSLTSNETLQEALSDVLNSINSAQVYFKAGLDVFESVLVGKN